MAGAIMTGPCRWRSVLADCGQMSGISQGRARMSKAIRNGTIVTADRTWKADVLVKGDRIVAIGPDLHGDHDLDATGCYITPGGIDPHTHLEMPFMGTYPPDNFESGTRAALSGGTT